MKLALFAIALVAIALWLVERWTRPSGVSRRRRETNNLRHITGREPWWKEPPGDEPDGDY